MLFCSVVSRNFVPHARVLAVSLSDHHPGARLALLVVDDPDEPARGDEPFRRVSLHEAGLSRAELHRRATMYAPQALVSSLKGRLLQALLERRQEPVLLVDADMLAFAPLDDVFELAARHAIVLTPHATVPLPFDPGGVVPEQTFIRAGTFNGGFLGAAPGAEAFLRWWDERCARDCVSNPDRGITLSQGWLALVSALFPHHVLRDRGVNLSGHGLGGDDLEWRGDVPSIDGTPIRLFHFGGGFDPRSGELGGARAPDWWPRTADHPGLARLCTDYARRLIAAGFDDSPPAGAQELDWPMRAAYRSTLIEADSGTAPEPPNPFTHGASAFEAWLSEPARPGSEVSRYLAALHAGRPDLRAAFPAVPGDDERALLDWVASKYPDGRLPAGLPTAPARS